MKRTKTTWNKETLLKKCCPDTVKPGRLGIIAQLVETGKAQKYRLRGIKKNDFISPGCREVN